MVSKISHLGLVTGYIFSLLLAVAPVAIAGYVPPRTQKPPSDYSKSGGVRGCPQDKIALTVLAPKKYVGQTTSAHPTFTWFVSNSYPVEFRLFEFKPNGEPQEIVTPISLQSSGISRYSLPQNQPGLTVGQKYLWQVSIKCPQGDLIEAAEFTVVQMPSMSNPLSTKKDGLEKVTLYAEAGLWYNALEEALKFAQDKKLGKVGANLLQDLAKSEEPDTIQKFTEIERQEMHKRIDNLKQIAINQP